ncbi:MAG: glycosyltransferase [Syntrophorhabdaceae bacterium]|nr:glycosyltransferase [Syntrophorhabdaceae bacterium]
MEPLVSINLCCYNSEPYLRETLDSITNQTYKNWELVIIDDGSSDSTGEIISEYIKKGYPIRYYYQENKGLGYSRNRAIKLSNGKYIAFIDHDDLWLPEKLEKQISLFEEKEEVGFIYTNFFSLKNGVKKIYFKRPNPEGYVFKDFLYSYSAALLTVMIRRSSIEGFSEFFDINLKLAEEYEFFMRILYKSKAAYIEMPLATYRIHEQMSSLKFIERWPDEMAYIMDKFSRIYTNFEEDYKKEISYMKAKIAYYKARAEMAKCNNFNARSLLEPYKTIDFKFFFLYIMTYLPPIIWHTAHRLMTKGAFSLSG